MPAKMIEDSISPDGHRLMTMQLKYWLPIHAEAKTHRVISINGEEYVVLTQDESFMDDPNLSRNAASNRAIPVPKVIEQVRNDPAMPIFWGKNQPGMQAMVEVDDIEAAKAAWIDGARLAADQAQRLHDMGLHKQVANRSLMAYQWMHVIFSATEIDGFVELRDHNDAQPEIRAVTQEIVAAKNASTPKLLRPGEWHLPYVSAQERLDHSIEIQIQLSTARNARVSYLTHDGKVPSVAKDTKLYMDLVGSRPLHASPAEHPATPDWKLEDGSWANPHLHGNFVGWIQHRKQLEQQLWSK